MGQGRGSRFNLYCYKKSLKILFYIKIKTNSVHLQEKTILVLDVVNSQTPLNFENGAQLYEVILASLEQAEVVELNFSGIQKTTSGVMNHSIGRNYRELGAEAHQKVKIAGIDPKSYLQKMIDISIQLAELGQEHHKRVVESINEISD